MPTLNWLTRDEDIRASSKAPYRLLEAVPEHSAGSDGENMLIHGDNLEALKALLPYYAGKVKCVYIDPPFNTNLAFKDYDDSLEHSLWLAMMYPRLEILRELIAENGSIYVHIDDNELCYLFAIMDEIFGRNNRVCMVTFKQGSATGHKAINPGMVSITNYILVYTKDKACWSPNRVYTARNRDNRYGQFIANYEESFTKWKFITLTKAFAQKKEKKINELKKELGASYEEELNSFILENAEKVIRTARPDYNAVGEDVKKAIDQSKAQPETILLHRRQGYDDMYFKNGERILFYKDKLKEIDGKIVSGEPLTTLWDDILSNNLHNEGGVEFPKSKKPEALIKRILELSTFENEIVLDSFLGSGTTAAVAHKMGRRYIGIEMGEHAVTLCAPRLKKVIEGEQGGISKLVNWKGGDGFRFYKLGEPVFDENGLINPKVRFKALAAHVWFSETGVPYDGKAKKPFLGIHGGIAYGLLYNGILGDKRVNGGNVLTRPVLKQLQKESGGFEGPWVIYGEMSRIPEDRLRTEKIRFKQTPYDVRAR